MTTNGDIAVEWPTLLPLWQKRVSLEQKNYGNFFGPWLEENKKLSDRVRKERMIW